ncbi:MAG: rod shape-determining protein MreD [Fimbriimonadales bacterium]
MRDRSGLLSWGGILGSALLLALAAALQGQASRLRVFGAEADFPLLVACTLALFETARGGSLLGFTAGFLQGCLVGSNLGYIAFSRTVAGYLAASSRRWIGPGVPTTVGVVFGCTAAANLLELLLPPAKAVFPSLGDTIGTATYNGVLAIPLYALLNRFFRPAKP